MGVEKSGTPHKRNATKYLRDTEPGYVLNLKTGLYEPASGDEHQYRYEPPPSGIGSQRPKGSLADWVSSIANFAAALVQLASSPLSIEMIRDVRERFVYTGIVVVRGATWLYVFIAGISGLYRI